MNRSKILLTRRWPAEVEAQLVHDHDVTLNLDDKPLGRDELAQALHRYDIICPTITDRFDHALLGNGPVRTRALCNFGAGTNHIDLDACRRLGIRVTNTPDVLTEDTADLAILLALMCARRAGEGERLVRAGQWSGWTPTQMLGQRMSGKIFGVIGFGRIGQATARRARHGFGMDVIYAARRPVAPEIAALSDARPATLETLLATADIISLHIPGGDGTRHMLDRHRLALMKPNAILVNTARGDVIDEEALADALEQGRLFAAGLDVHEREPAVSARLRERENVVLLPHLGSATSETRIAMGLRARENLEAVLRGDEPRDLVA